MWEEQAVIQMGRIDVKSSARSNIMSFKHLDLSLICESYDDKLHSTLTSFFWKRRN